MSGGCNLNGPDRDDHSTLTDRGHLLTEQRNASSAELDQVSIEDAFDVMNDEDRRVADAVRASREPICAAIRLVSEALGAGGRLIYVGAGTSGRLGVIDAAECPPTFMTAPGMVRAVIAGGPEAMLRSIEGAEDRVEEGEAAIAALGVHAGDVVLGIASGGTTPFVHAALRRAAQRGAKTVFLACVPYAEHPDEADVSIRVLTGPEVLAGSTRLKAGTATKMVVNMITTLSMVQLGRVFGNLMVELNRDACIKLQDRAVRIVAQATGLERSAAARLLAQAGDVKCAIVMHHRKVDRAAARHLLQAANGRLRNILT